MNKFAVIAAILGLGACLGGCDNVDPIEAKQRADEARFALNHGYVSDYVVVADAMECPVGIKPKNTPDVTEDDDTGTVTFVTNIDVLGLLDTPSKEIRARASHIATCQFEETFAKFPKVKTVVAKFQTVDTDDRGQNRLVQLVTLKMSRQTAKTIAWSSFTPGNLPRVADQYWENPAIVATGSTN